MPRTPKDVTAAELAVLRVLWSRGRSAIHEISEILYPADAVKKYSTVKRLLGRLEDKKYVRRDDEGPLIHFEAAQTREDLVGRRIEELVDTVCEGSISQFLTHLSNTRGLTRQQQTALRQLIDDLKQQQPSAKRGREERGRD